MGLVLKESSTFQLAPEGQWLAVCVDVVDLGLVETEWQGKKRMTHKCRIVWELSEEKADGTRFIASRRFTASLADKATLRRVLESWRGKKFTVEELEGFDTEALIGVNAVLQVVHTRNGDKTYDDVLDGIQRPLKGTAALKPSGKYVRVKDRPDYAPPVTQAPDAPAHSDADFPAALADDTDDLPF